MAGHNKASKESQHLCNSLVEEIQKLLPDVNRDETKDICALFVPGKNRFAYVQHRSKSGAITVYFRGDVSDAFALQKQLPVQIRPKVEKGYEKEFPYFIKTDRIELLPVVAQLIIINAYPLSGRKKEEKKHDKERIEAFWGKPQVIETPKASDINDPPQTTRIETTTYRILRDTALALEVKAAHEFKCQLCSKTIFLGDGSMYAEAHHVKPLGSPFNGPDVKENIICVCPTCHVLLDYKVIKLDHSQVPNVSPVYIEYHNNVICKKINSTMRLENRVKP